MHLTILFLRTFMVTLVSLAPIWGCLAIIMSLGGILVGELEGIGWAEGLYFGWVTGTTVGYGDIVPTRPLTKVLSVAIGMIGVINTGLVVTMAVNASKVVIEYEGLISGIKEKIEKKLHH